MYSGKIGPSVATGGAVVAGSQFGIAPYILIGLGVLVAGFIIARVMYHKRHAARSGS